MARAAKKTKADARAVAAAPEGAENVSAAETPASGAEMFIPLNKLKKSPRNARKTPHSTPDIEAYAASIAAKGILQNLVVEPELDADGKPTGFYLVTIGEGRRLAQLLRAKRKEIKKTEPIRCVIDTANDPFEISLDENVTRTAMHPADQFEAFRELAENRGLGAEEIAARFGVTAHVVRQRLRLGAVSPKLITVYRDGGLTLDQLMAFAITEDHARQEDVFANLPYNREPSQIRRDLMRTHVSATDRRAVFVGVEAYTEAGGVIIRDLFTEDRGGYFEDAALLDRLVSEKLETIARKTQEAEGWKWLSVHIDYPHAHGLSRVYPQPVDLSDEDEAAYDAAQQDYGRLSSEYEDADDVPSDVEDRLAALDAEIERLDAKRHAYEADEIACGGVIVALSHDGTVRIERGFIRPEDEAPASDEAEDERDDDERFVGGAEDSPYTDAPPAETEDEDASDPGKPLADSLIRDLTAHRTLALRLTLGEQPDIALVAVTHALAAQTFYRHGAISCLDITTDSLRLADHADGIEDTGPAKMLADRHAGWAADMPRDVAHLWRFVAGLDHASIMALLAHCAALTLDAVRQPWERKSPAYATGARLATALGLDMTVHWTPTTRTYFSRVVKAHILAAVREAVNDEAAERIATMKKQPMAEAAEQLVAGTGWLPALMRTEAATRDGIGTTDGDRFSEAAE
jgi:ParB family chromosome partitioning protein